MLAQLVTTFFSGGWMILKRDLNSSQKCKKDKFLQISERRFAPPHLTKKSPCEKLFEQKFWRPLTE